MMNDLSPSYDATLKALAVSTGKISPGFSASRKNYSVYVAHGIDSIRVIPTANESGATLTVNGTAAASSQESGSISLDVGRNVITRMWLFGGYIPDLISDVCRV